MKFFKIFISTLIFTVLLASNHKFNVPFVEVAKNGNPYVVSIIAEKKYVEQQFNPFFNDPFFEDFFPDFPQFERKGESLGSGVIIDKKGYIITNNHVVEDADKITVILYNDKTEYEANIIGVDPLSDLAIIQVETDITIPNIKMGDSDDLEVGEWVVAIGSPFGLHLNHTVTAGIVSATGRSNVISKLSYEDFIQHDAAINPGNSGGALLNLNGELIGINTAIATDGYSRANAGVGFAIPINQAKRVVEDLISDGAVSRGWLGVQIQPINEEISKALGLDSMNGALVVSIIDDSPASESDLMEDDIIVKVDNKDIEDQKELMKVIADKHPGDTAIFTVLRGDEKLRISVKLGTRPIDGKLAKSNTKIEESKSFDIIGLKVSNTDNGVGVKIASVEKGSSAFRNGFRVDDVILKIGRESITSKSQYENLISNYEKGDVIMLRVMRDGNQGVYGFTIN